MMSKISFAVLTLLLALVLPIVAVLVDAQVTTSPSATGVAAPQSSVAITGGTIDGVTAGATVGLTSITMGSGNTGFIIMPYTGGGYAAIYSTSVTPGASNETLISNGSITDLNGATNTQLYVAGSVKMGCASGGCTNTGTFSSSGHLSSSTSNTPTISSGACGSGTNGTIAGTDQDGKITVGAATTTTCAVTFGSTTWVTGPNSCTFSPASAASAAVTVLPYVSAVSSSGFTLSGSILATTSFYYHCG